MNSQQHPQNDSNFKLSNVSKESGGSGTSHGSKVRARLFTKISKLVKHSGSPRSMTTISAPTLTDPFQITHERDEIPAYIPAQSKQPRTSSECREALEEMFAHSRGEDSPQETEPTHAKSVTKNSVEQRVPNQRYVN